MKTVCSKCAGPIEVTRIERQRYCRKCHAESMRLNRPKYKDLPSIEKLKSNARASSRHYLRRGVIEKKPCEVCGSIHSEMHHPDYTKPKQVVWLCRIHHLEVHKMIA